MANSLFLCIFLVMHFQVTISSSLSFSSPSSPQALCPQDQSQALLQFKNSFSIDRNASYAKCDASAHQISYPKTESWKEGTDCCSWKGVKCNSVTGHVISLDLSCSWLTGIFPSNISLFLLPHLQRLNLAQNDFRLSPVSPNFAQISSLTHLNLSASLLSGFVPSEISQLSKLVSLDLSYNGLKFHRLHFQMLVRNLTELRHLILDELSLSLVVPGSLQNLSSSITTLHFAGSGLGGKLPNNIFSYPHLQELRLRNNKNLVCNFPKSNWSSSIKLLDLSQTTFVGSLPDSTGHLKSLEELYLFSCGFRGSIPASIANLTKLTLLDLSSNKFAGQLPPSLSKLRQLTYLDLSENDLAGKIPNAFSNLTRVSNLCLGNNNFTGQLPFSVLNLTQLKIMDFSRNQLEGPLPSHIKGLPSLERIDLSSNLLTGRIPSWLFTQPSLDCVALHHNNFTGPIEPFQQATSSIKELYLQNNEIAGPIPSCLFQSLNLTSLDLSLNRLSGFLDSDMFLKLKNLKSLDLSSNSLLSMRTSNKVNYSLPSLKSFRFSSCAITEFPNFLRIAENLEELDLSNNSISGSVKVEILSELKHLVMLNLSHNTLLSLESNKNANFFSSQIKYLHLSSCNISSVPRFFRSLGQLEMLDLSNNNIHGQISKEECGVWQNLAYLDLSNNSLTGLEQHAWQKMVYLNLRSNLLQGPLPIPPLSTKALFLTENNLNGEIPSLICNLSSLMVLDLGYNNFSGMIPKCLGNSGENLLVLDLRMNNFHGSLPATFSEAKNLRSLNVNGNQLQGPLPHSFRKCANLEFLNLGNNKINDTFPYWLETLPKLKVLELRSNSFYGSIDKPKAKSPFPRLRVLDLSRNKFTGTLPNKYFESMMAMVNVDEEKGQITYLGNSYCHASMTFTMKKVDIQFPKILTTFTAIDMSSNRFKGQIPQVIGKLSALRVLNFSHNSLAGPIPLSLGNLTLLESLDLSSNRLSGEIPMQLANLSCLSAFNLSHNRLVGPIPQGNQFNTFENDSYIDNLGLCGSPLSNTCNNEAADPPYKVFQQKDFTRGFAWKIAMIGYSSGTVIGLSMGYIVFATGKPQWFVRIIEDANWKIRRRANQRFKGRKINRQN